MNYEKMITKGWENKKEAFKIVIQAKEKRTKNTSMKLPNPSTYMKGKPMNLQLCGHHRCNSLPKKKWREIV
jgi:hypothetical protein